MKVTAPCTTSDTELGNYVLSGKSPMPHKSSLLSQGALPLSACLPSAAACTYILPPTLRLEGIICQLGLVEGKGQKGCTFTAPRPVFPREALEMSCPGWLVSAPIQASHARVKVLVNHWPTQQKRTNRSKQWIYINLCNNGNFITIIQVYCCIFRCAAEWMLPVTKEAGSAPKSIDFQFQMRMDGAQRRTEYVCYWIGLLNRTRLTVGLPLI